MLRPSSHFAEYTLFLFEHSLVAVPASYKTEIDLLHAWDEEDFTYC
jgi:hypothetical protein